MLPLTYDMTLVNIDLEMEKLNKQQLEVKKKGLEQELKDLKNGKMSSVAANQNYELEFLGDSNKQWRLVETTSTPPSEETPETPQNPPEGESQENNENQETPDGGETPQNPDGGETPRNPDGGETPQNPDGGETPENPDGGETPEEPEAPRRRIHCLQSSLLGYQSYRPDSSQARGACGCRNCKTIQTGRRSIVFSL